MISRILALESLPYFFDFIFIFDLCFFISFFCFCFLSFCFYVFIHCFLSRHFDVVPNALPQALSVMT